MDIRKRRPPEKFGWTPLRRSVPVLFGGCPENRCRMPTAAGFPAADYYFSSSMIGFGASSTCSGIWAGFGAPGLGALPLPLAPPGFGALPFAPPGLGAFAFGALTSDWTLTSVGVTSPETSPSVPLASSAFSASYCDA